MNTEQLDYILTLMDECHKRSASHPSRSTAEWDHYMWWRRVLTLREYCHLDTMPPKSYITYVEAQIAAMPDGAWAESEGAR